MDGVFFDGDRRIANGELLSDRPVCRDTTTIDQPGCSQEEGAAANGAIAARARSDATEPLDDRGGRPNIRRVWPPRHEQRIDLYLRRVADDEIRGEPDPRRAADVAGGL